MCVNTHSHAPYTSSGQSFNMEATEPIISDDKLYLLKFPPLHNC